MFNEIVLTDLMTYFVIIFRVAIVLGQISQIFWDVLPSHVTNALGFTAV